MLNCKEQQKIPEQKEGAKLDIQIGCLLWIPDCARKKLIEGIVTKLDSGYNEISYIEIQTNDPWIGEKLEIIVYGAPKRNVLNATTKHMFFLSKKRAQNFLNNHDPFAGYTETGRALIIDVFSKTEYGRYSLPTCRTETGLKRKIRDLLHTKLSSCRNIEESNDVLKLGKQMGAQAYVKGTKRTVPVDTIEIVTSPSGKSRYKIGNVYQGTRFYEVHRRIEFCVTNKV